MEVPGRKKSIDSVGSIDSSDELPGEAPSPARRKKSSVIQSSLPSLFNSLRTSESADGSDTRNFLRRVLSTRSTDSGSDERARRSSSPKLKEAANILEKIRSSDEEMEVSFFKNIGQTKIPVAFLKDGLPLLKVSQKSKKRVFIQIDVTNFIFSWHVANLKSSDPPEGANRSRQNSIQRFLSGGPSIRTKNYTFGIDDIKTVMLQADARHCREELNISKEFEKQWLTMSYFNHNKDKIKTLHLVADTEHDVKKLYSTIMNLIRLREELARRFFIDIEQLDEHQRGLVLTEDSSKKSTREYLSFDDILKYTKRLNINVNSGYLRSIFDELEGQTVINDTKVLNFDEFKTFVAMLKRRSDISAIWSQLCERQTMTVEEFKRFLSDVQHESFSDDEIQRQFNKFCVADSTEWTIDNFNSYLLSKFSKPYRENLFDSTYYDQPLNEYYISSSHNTYLTGRQVADESSADAYVKVLQKGCRCVEIDIWDGEDPSTGESGPVVRHGRAFTTSISLRNVLLSIKRYAFVASPFPLILSLEVNCSSENQLKTKNLLIDVFEASLVLEPIDGVFLLPSPNSLQHKVLLKVKRTSPFTNVIMTENGTLTTSSTTSTSFSEDGLSASSRSTMSSFSRKKKKHHKILDALSELGVYIQGVRFRNFSLPESKTFNHCFSLNEKVIDSMFKDEVKRTSLDKHNRRHLMRVYPSKMRVKSSNFSPINYWIHGVQMVATNWQTYDLGQQINEALFEGAGRFGYVLKPVDLRKPLLKYTMRQATYEIRKKKFHIEVISAHQLPKPTQGTNKINPYVKFEILGAKEIQFDTNSSTSNTSIVPDNGFNPIWNQRFSGTVKSSELMFVKFSVYTSVSPTTIEDPKPLGVFVTKLDFLKQGYRYLPLNDILGEGLIYTSLFVKISYS